MATLVTGATGLLGSHLVDLLVERGESVRALVRPNEDVERLKCLGVDVRRGDLADRASLEDAVPGVDRVLHCAARTGPWGPEAEYELANVTGLRTLLEASLAAGVQRFVHVSSITVHGNDVGGMAEEASPYRIDPNPYSRTKVKGELLVQQMIADKAAPVTIVRPGLIYGPRDASSFGRLARRIERRKMFVIGSGKNRLPLIYVRDVAEGILLASTANRTTGRTYLLVNDEPITQLDYFAAIAAELGVPAPRFHVPYRWSLVGAAMVEFLGNLLRSKRPPPLTRFGLNVLGGNNQFMIDRARQDFDFSPRVYLQEGVRRSVAWYRASPCATAG